MNHEYPLILIAKITSGELISQNENLVVSDFTTDTRKISFAKNSIFIALKGEQFDGHKFIREAYNQGIRSFMVNQIPEDIDTDECSFVKVADSTLAFQKWMAYHRNQFDIPVLGITGSNGKTVVKEWLNQLLADDFKITRSPNSYNSQIGVPKSIWYLNQSTELGIFEAGISMPGEMSVLEQIIKPTFGLLTNIGSSHLENFLDTDELINEKLKLFENCNEVFTSSKNKKVLNKLEESSANVITWGIEETDKLRVLNIDETSEAAFISCEYESEILDFTFDLTDAASLENIMHCILLMLNLKYDQQTIQNRISRIANMDMRLAVHKGIAGSTLLNDAYSLDMNSLLIALDVINRKAKHKKKVVILSDFSHLNGADTNYSQLNKMLKEYNIDLLVGIGNGYRKHEEVFELETDLYDSKEEFIERFDEKMIESSFVLIKGARVSEFEQIADRLQEKTHQTVLEINMESVAHNLNFFRSKLEPNVRLMVMVKAFSYGSGGKEMANFLQFNRVDYLGVAYVDEGIELRKQGVSLPIMVMSPEKSGLRDCLRYHLEPEIYQSDILKELILVLKRNPDSEIRIHLKVDTGMNRLGFNEDDVMRAVELIKENPQIEVASVFTHLSSADDPKEDVFTRGQLSNYKTISTKIENTLGTKFIKHALNTSGILKYPEFQFDMVRLGIGLHGISPIPEFRNQLRPTATLKARITQIRRIAQGDSVGYSRSFIADGDSKIAIIPIGYADGLSRALGNEKCKLFLNGSEVSIIGNVCMDMTILDVSNVDCKVGDEVIVFGPQFPIENLSEALNTIPYEVMTSISQRVTRVYNES